MIDIVFGTITILIAKTIIEYYFSIKISGWLIIGIMLTLYIFKEAKNDKR
ncbi:hypothetical protein [Anaerofustis stercorihominis]